MLKYSKYILPSLSQIFILVFFYFNLRNNGKIFFIDASVENYYTPIIITSCFIFFAANFMMFLITNCHNQKPIIQEKEYGDEENKEDLDEYLKDFNQVMYRAIGHVFCVAYTFFNIILFLVILVGSSDHQKQLPYSADLLFSIALYFYVGCIFAFIFALLINLSLEYRPVIIKHCAKRPWLVCFFYAAGAVFAPLYTIYLFVLKMRSLKIKLPDFWLDKTRFLTILANLAFTIFYSVFLAVEYYLISTGDMRDWSKLMFRAIAIFLLFYLPYKMLSMISDKKKSNIYFELISAGIFFIAQILIIDLMIE